MAFVNPKAEKDDYYASYYLNYKLSFLNKTEYKIEEKHSYDGINQVRESSSQPRCNPIFLPAVQCALNTKHAYWT